MLPFLQQTFYGGQNQPRRTSNYSDILMALNSMSVDRYDLEVGNKVLLPSSALQQLINTTRQSGPMIFKLQNTLNNKVMYVGVLEFISEEGTCVVPNWIFESMGMFEGCQIVIQLAPKLPKGRLIKLQPHETAFIDLPDPRAVLENQLRNHVCLTKGTTITVQFTGRQYQIDILDVTPESDFKAVDINEADVEIDFAPPLDYDEGPPPNLLKKTSQLKVEDAVQKSDGITVFQGQGVRIDGKAGGQVSRKLTEDLQQQVQEPYNPRKHKLNHGVKSHIQDQVFQGTGGVKVTNTKPQLK